MGEKTDLAIRKIGAADRADAKNLIFKKPARGEVNKKRALLSLESWGRPYE